MDKEAPNLEPYQIDEALEWYSDLEENTVRTLVSTIIEKCTGPYGKILGYRKIRDMFLESTVLKDKYFRYKELVDNLLSKKLSGIKEPAPPHRQRYKKINCGEGQLHLL